jgi:uncharacterized protein YhbP (UPF0306 family)
MIPEHIAKFMQKQDCATICCVDAAGHPYCFNCFYAFNANEAWLVFKSGNESHHASLLQANANVAGAVLPNKLQTLLVKGMQFEGKVLHGSAAQKELASAGYYKKNPMAIAMPGELWIIQLRTMKMTDNSQGFGKKIHWQKA